MNPHEETWTVGDEESVLTGAAVDCEWSTRLRHISWGMGDCAARARLAAQAPAMARLLLSLGAMDVYDTDARGRPVHTDRYRCSWCDGESEDVAAVPHLHDCRLVAVLKAAGVIE